MTYPDALFLIALLAFWAFVLWLVTRVEPTHKQPWHEIWPWRDKSEDEHAGNHKIPHD